MLCTARYQSRLIARFVTFVIAFQSSIQSSGRHCHSIPVGLDVPVTLLKTEDKCSAALVGRSFIMVTEDKCDMLRIADQALQLSPMTLLRSDEIIDVPCETCTN
jgi:hypothetical protein